MLHKSFHKHDDGFSLIELAIVLLVIGLIVGGILKGQELIESARLRSLVNQIQEYRTATSIFLEKYGRLPGDYHHAKDYIDDTLINGNNNSMIEGQGLTANSETLSFWAHLAAANLIAPPDKLIKVPTTKLGGVITVHYGDFDTAQHWFVVGAPAGDTAHGALLTPSQAMSIDQKVDNGDPVSGHFRAQDAVGTTADNKCLIDNKYNLKNTKPACVIYFMM